MKRRNYLKTTLMIFIMVIGIFVNAVQPVKAEAIIQATPYTVGTNVNGVLAEGGDDRVYYMFNLPSSGSVHITGSAYMARVYLYIFDDSANQVWRVNPVWNRTSEVISLDETVYLTSGTYYFCVGRDGHYGNYNVRIDFTSSNESFKEINGGSNNTINTASRIETTGMMYNAQLAENDEKDFFQFTLAVSGKVNFNATFNKMKWVKWKLYDQSGEELLSRSPVWNNTTENIVVDEDIYLTSGTYYLAISRDGSNGKYSFSLPFITSNETYSESEGGSNNSIETASELVLEKLYTGALAVNDKKDFYHFNLVTDQTVTVNSDLQMQWAYIKLYDAQGNEIWSESPSWNSITQTINFSRKTTLNRGNYYLAVVQNSGKCGNYTLKISRLTQENCPHDECYEEWVDATYFAKGYKKHTCKDCGYTYKSDYQPVKKLSQVYLYNYYNAGKGSLKIYWDYQSDASGYQIRYCRGKNFKSGVITKTIKGSSKNNYTIKKLNRNKTYYVQVRSYKKSGSKTVYGKWSAKKSMKTK